MTVYSGSIVLKNSKKMGGAIFLHAAIKPISKHCFGYGCLDGLCGAISKSKALPLESISFARLKRPQIFSRLLKTEFFSRIGR